ncbi:zf-HC2 domain-containing protein [Amycolatopsis sp. NPDC098790]|uniref:zf-HC2 domain-containing protein n=1 Tax=Amycolatopsis sp. NPDC098790 TaxID=3363939 RepID=UPI0037FEF690
MRAEHRAAAAYELGVLDDAEEFETHLRGCPRCRELLAEFHPVSEALGEAVRLGYLPGGGSPGGGAPESGGSSGAGSPVSGGSSSAASPGSSRSAGAGSPMPGGPAGAGSPVSGGSSAVDPASGTIRQPAAGYPAPSGGAARHRKPGAFSRRRGMAAGAFLLLALGAIPVVARAARPATARTWFASAASIVSPAHVVAGTGRDLRDPPWRAGFQ